MSNELKRVRVTITVEVDGQPTQTAVMTCRDVELNAAYPEPDLWPAELYASLYDPPSTPSQVVVTVVPAPDETGRWATLR